jgi:DNA-binding CsgD family transcriptional regulator
MNRIFQNDWMAQLFRRSDDEPNGTAAHPYFILPRRGAVAELAREIGMTAPLHPILCFVNGTLPQAELVAVTALLPTLPRNVGLAAVVYRFDRALIRVLYEAGVRHFTGSAAGSHGFLVAGRNGSSAGAYFSDELLQHWLDRGGDAIRIRSSFGLTEREFEVVKMIARRMSNKEIATELGVSVRTIEAHRLNIRRKLGINGFEESFSGFGLPQ